jgi:hypothetical protein
MGLPRKSLELLPLDWTTDHPKRVLEAALASVGRRCNRETMSQLAACVDADEAARRCPRSFRPFRESLDQALRGL